MRWLRTLRADFSPYEFGVAQAVLIQVTLFIMLFAMWAGHASPARGFLFVSSATLILCAVALDWLTGCPVCGKHATMRLLSRRKVDRMRLLQIRRSWPERTCSECTHDLTLRGTRT